MEIHAQPHVKPKAFTQQLIEVLPLTAALTQNEISIITYLICVENNILLMNLDKDYFKLALQMQEHDIPDVPTYIRLYSQAAALSNSLRQKLGLADRETKGMPNQFRIPYRLTQRFIHLPIGIFCHPQDLQLHSYLEVEYVPWATAEMIAAWKHQKEMTLQTAKRI